MRVWTAIPIEYTTVELLSVTLKLDNAIRTLPNLPTGESIACVRSTDVAVSIACIPARN